jgi:Family of unknown function (DUF6338)
LNPDGKYEQGANVDVEGLAKIDAIYVALVFIVPGFVFLSLRNQFVAGQGKIGKEQILSYLTISGVNFALCGWIIYIAYKDDADVPVKAASWIVVIILIPAVAGIASGVCNQRDYFRKIFHHFNFEPIHAVPSAWDYKFSKSPGEWVLVKLKDGTQFAGWWAGQSFASDDRTERDLLIEQVFEVPERGPWISTSKSLLIMAGEIQTIEFTPNHRNESNDEASHTTNQAVIQAANHETSNGTIDERPSGSSAE